MSYVRSNIRIFTEAELTELAPVLLEGEIILVKTESGEERFLMGDGSTPWNELEFLDEDLTERIVEELKDDLEELEDSLKEELEDKLSIKVSAEDAGKVLSVDESGNIVPVKVTQDNIEGEIAGKASDFTWGELYGTEEVEEDSYTSKLNLKLPGYSSKADIQDINANFRKLDEIGINIEKVETSLQTKVTEVNAKIDTSIDSVETTILERDAATNNRVDNLLNELTNNPEYAPTAEVVDIRAGYDGVTYQTAGDAVRSIGQTVEEIKKNLQTINPNDLGLFQDEETGIVYPTFKGIQSINGIPLSAGGGGGGGMGGSSSTVMKLRRYPIDSDAAFTIGKGSDAKISYTFTSEDLMTGSPTGRGTASYFVNDELIYNTSVPQGITEINVAEHLKIGTNTVTVSILDADGNKRTLSWNITVVEISIASEFDYSMIYEDKVIFKYTAYGDADKTVHFLIDNTEVSTQSVSSDGKITTQEFTGLSHGLHTLEVYSTAIIYGSLVESNHLKYDVIVREPGQVTPIISMNCNVTEIIQGELLVIPYIVYDPVNEEKEVTLSVLYLENDEYKTYSTEKYIVNNAENEWRLKSYPAGTVRFVVSLRNISRSIVVNVTKFELPIAPVNNDLELFLTAEGRSNSEVNPAKWEYKGVTTDFHNVNWSSSGWVKDENGDSVLRLMGGSSATINFQPFKNLKGFGRTLEFEFAIRNVNNRGANVISCKSDDNIGFEITADAARLFSKAFTPELNKIECRFGDERKIRVAFTISSKQEYRLASIFIDGVMTHVSQYNEDDNWEQFNPVNIQIGSPYCCVDLYTIRCYSDALSHENLINNYICDLPNIEDRRTEYNKNNLYDNKRNLLYDKIKEKIQVMTIIGELPTSKGSKKDVYIDYYDPFDSEMNFTDRYCKIDVQGTSSQGYRVKNYKLKFNDKFAHIKGGIPTKTYCMKADYAEGTSTHNTGIANLAHTLYSEPIPPQEDDPRCRTTIQGFPCVIFHKATVDDEPKFVGKYNFNYDKGSEEAFGFTEDYDVESWEFKVNDEPDCNYLRNILPYYKEIGENNAESGWVKSFERRYPDHDLIDDIWKLSPEDANKEIARFRAMHDWVVSTKDWNLADKDVLKKYRAEFQEIFSLHYVLVYYVWTFFFLMVDQRAKNMFMTYWGETSKWYPYLYDNDRKQLSL